MSKKRQPKTHLLKDNNVPYCGNEIGKAPITKIPAATTCCNCKKNYEYSQRTKETFNEIQPTMEVVREVSLWKKFLNLFK